MSRFIPSLAILTLGLSVFPGATPLRAQQDLKQEIARALGESQKGLAASIARIIEQRTSKLEKALQQRDAKIQQLEKRLAELAKAAVKKPEPKKPEPKKPEPKKPEPKKPEPKKPEPTVAPTGAFLGVGHVDHGAGAQITTVHPDSPAAAAKLSARDVITAINGAKVSSETLGRIVTTHKPGVEITVDFVRGDKKMQAKVKLVDRRAFFTERENRAKADQEKKPAHIVLGVTIEEDDKGVFAYEVEAGFTGAVAGLKKGDRITHVGGKAVKTLDEIEAAVKAAKAGDQLALRTSRGDEVIEIVVVGSADKGGAKLVSRKETKPKKDPPKKDPPKKDPPKPVKKPGFLGVGLGPVDGGLSVEIVVPDSAAAAYGIQKGDVVTHINGQAVDSTEKLQAALGGKSAGAAVEIKIKRGDKEVTVALVLGVRGEKFKKPEPKKAEPKKAEPKKAEPKKAEPKKAEPKKDRKRGTLGVQARETSDDQVKITDVTPGGAAEKAGVKAGDLLLKVGDAAIKSFGDLSAAMKSAHAGDAVTLRVRRADGSEVDLKVTLGEPLLSDLDG